MDLIYCTSQNCPYKSSCLRAQHTNENELLFSDKPQYYDYSYECTLSDGFQFYVKK